MLGTSFGKKLAILTLFPVHTLRFLIIVEMFLCHLPQTVLSSMYLSLLYAFDFNLSNQYITLMRTHIYTCLFVSTDLIMRIPWESFLALSRKA